MRKIAKLSIAFTLAALAALTFTACGSDGADAKDGTVAATVNGKPIMKAEIEQLIVTQTGGKQAQMTELALAQARLQILDGLIQQEVLFQRADKEKLLPTEDEVSQYITAKKQEGGMTEQEFQKQLAAQNQTEAAYREQTRKLLAIQKLQNKYTGSVNIDNREVEEYFLANRDQFKLGRGVELADIVVDPRDNGMQDDAKSEAEAKIKIDGIYQNLKAGDFAEIARAKSEDASNQRGGDIGFATEDALKQNGFPAALIAEFFSPSMQIGSYTQPVQFNGRWFIFKLKKKQLENENRTLESLGVRQEITEGLRSQRQQLLNAALLELSQNEAKVVNNLASEMVANPNKLGLRPAVPGVVPSPAASAAASPPATAPKASSPTTASSPAASPAKK